jgi:hypothetical protein
MTQKKAALYITRESPQVRVLLTPQTTHWKQTQLWYIKQQEK